MTQPDPLSAMITNALVDQPEVAIADLVARARGLSPLDDAGSIADRVEHLVARARGLGVISPLLDDPAVTEVMVNGPGRVWLDRGRSVEPSDVVVSAVDIALLIERILDPLGLRVDRVSPFVDARLADGSRVNIVVPPVALDGPLVTIRRFVAKAVLLEHFGPPPLVEILNKLVAGRVTMIVVGGTSAGKTTLLNALGTRIDAGERVVTIEDTAELALSGDHVVRLEARSPNREGVGGITIRQLVRNALRMRPDRLIVGEVRGGEALDLLMALNTGHAGSLATCHANNPIAGLRRLQTLALMGGVDLPLPAIRDQLIAAVDIVVSVGRIDGQRLVTSVAEVDPDRLAVSELWPHTEAALRRPAVIRALQTC